MPLAVRSRCRCFGYRLLPPPGADDRFVANSFLGPGAVVPGSRRSPRVSFVVPSFRPLPSGWSSFRRFQCRIGFRWFQPFAAFIAHRCIHHLIAPRCSRRALQFTCPDDAAAARRRPSWGQPAAGRRPRGRLMARSSRPPPVHASPPLLLLRLYHRMAQAPLPLEPSALTAHVWFWALYTTTAQASTASVLLSAVPIWFLLLPICWSRHPASATHAARCLPCLLF